VPVTPPGKPRHPQLAMIPRQSTNNKLTFHMHPYRGWIHDLGCGVRAVLLVRCVAGGPLWRRRRRTGGGGSRPRSRSRSSRGCGRGARARGGTRVRRPRRQTQCGAWRETFFFFLRFDVLIFKLQAVLEGCWSSALEMDSPCRHHHHHVRRGGTHSLAFF
jgi:hypothetical protein